MGRKGERRRGGEKRDGEKEGRGLVVSPADGPGRLSELFAIVYASVRLTIADWVKPVRQQEREERCTARPRTERS